LEENIKNTNDKNDQLSKENEIFYYKLEALKDDYQELEEKYSRLQRDFVQKSHVIIAFYF
jgi:acyl carrier protein phosphodiesterase